MPLRVDGIEISDERIREEMQYHPAPSLEDARRQARDALVVRSVLLAEARRIDFEAPAPIADPANKLVEAPEEALIRALVDSEVRAPEPSEEECRDYYAENPSSFRSPDLLQAAHILFAADPKDELAMAKARTRAEAALARLRADPGLFPKLARELSDCSSAKDGGGLGQITRGSTIPELETFLFALEPGQICPIPIRTRYGFHIARLDERLDGRQLPYEAVRNRIMVYLRERHWRQAVREYIGRLAARASIEEAEAEPAPEGTGCGDSCGCAKSAGGAP
ncbi:MAG: peptidylprolyl isomerase [Hyphomicrobiaceae bacterium]|nr:peptidylprolyl isomerase [Hyphomicrobiaceae bacterium]